MSFLGSMFNSNGGAGWQAGGAGGVAPTQILNPTTTGQADTSYGQAQTGLAQQQAFMNALQAQNGIQNQSNVYNQLQGVANGTGPNPAQAQLAQSTGANTANQAALMAGQRGAGSNVGMIARQAAQQGGANQQNAAGQAATMQANQSLNALNQLGGIAGQQVGQQAGAVQGYNAAAQGEQGNILNSIGQQNNANVGMQSNMNSAQSGVAGANAATQGKGALGFLGLAEGGKVTASHQSFTNYRKNFAVGGVTAPSMIYNNPPPTPQSNTYDSRGGNSSMSRLPGLSNMPGKILSAFKPTSSSDSPIEGVAGADSLDQLSAPAMMVAANGGKVPAMLSPGEKYLNPKEAAMMKEGKASLGQVGKKVPGEPKVKGDNYKNDTFPAKLEEGGMVIPNSVMQSKNPEWAAHKFVRAHMAMGGQVGGKNKKAKKT